jgi:hypothetical protein
MSVLKKLVDGAIVDVGVLRSLDEQGDDFTKFRDVDFLLRCPTQEKAELVAAFINEYQFGQASVFEEDEKPCVQVIINMPVTRNVILSVSGFMACIATMYELDFDGWGCEVQE